MDIYEIYDSMPDCLIVEYANMDSVELMFEYGLSDYDSHKLFSLIVSRYIEMVI